MQNSSNIDIEERNRILDDKKRDGRSIPIIVICISYLVGAVSLLFGIALGLTLRNSKTILSDTTKVYLFNEKVRKHGRNIMIVSSLFTLVDAIITIVILFIGYKNPEKFMEILDYL